MTTGSNYSKRSRLKKWHFLDLIFSFFFIHSFITLNNQIWFSNRVRHIQMLLLKYVNGLNVFGDSCVVMWCDVTLNVLTTYEFGSLYCFLNRVLQIRQLFLPIWTEVESLDCVQCWYGPLDLLRTHIFFFLSQRSHLKLKIMGTEVIWVNSILLL